MSTFKCKVLNQLYELSTLTTLLQFCRQHCQQQQVVPCVSENRHTSIAIFDTFFQLLAIPDFGVGSMVKLDITFIR